MTLRLGGYGIDYHGDPEAYARAHVAFGYNAAYMPNISIDNRDEIAAIIRACRLQLNPYPAALK